MSIDGGVEQPAAAPPLPRSIWVVAWTSLAGQAAVLVRQGGRVADEVSLVVSVVGGALLVGSVAAGVGVLVGVLGGLAGPVDDGLEVRMRISVADR